MATVVMAAASPLTCSPLPHQAMPSTAMLDGDAKRTYPTYSPSAPSRDAGSSSMCASSPFSAAPESNRHCRPLVHRPPASHGFGQAALSGQDPCVRPLDVGRRSSGFTAARNACGCTSAISPETCPKPRLVRPAFGNLVPGCRRVSSHEVGGGGHLSSTRPGCDWGMTPSRRTWQ